MRLFGLMVACAALSLSSPTFATKYRLNWKGTVTTVEGNAPGSDIRVGDAISAAFSYDDTLTGPPTMLPLGGGVYTIYRAPIIALTLSVGSYTHSFSSFDASLAYMNNSFGMDGIEFLLGGLPGGPFASTFANAQFQARGPITAIDGTGKGNGLPYSRFVPGFLIGFGNASSAERVFGTLSVSESTVPEPLVWMGMLIGFALTGSEMRRNRVGTAMRENGVKNFRDAQL